MSDQPKLLRNDNYEDFATAHHCTTVHNLNEALKQHGVDDSDQRQAICKTFIFGACNVFDQYGYKVEDGSIFPILGFADKSVEMVDEPDELNSVVCAGDYFSHHEMAERYVYLYFEEYGEDADRLGCCHLSELDTEDEDEE